MAILLPRCGNRWRFYCHAVAIDCDSIATAVALDGDSITIATLWQWLAIIATLLH
jgi:hypothetical protein